jgi:two-component system nitrogen regulation sensor histidine kinase NtrY
VKVRTKGDRVQITVIDNGCGLPEENRERLVEPYMTTRTKGTGLGLAIVQRITEQHGGTLHLADAPMRNGKMEGASVRMDLPIREPEDLPADERPPPPAAAVSEPSAPGAANAAKEKEEEGVTHGV